MNKTERFLAALEEMRAAINGREFEKLARHVDVEEFLSEGYEEVTDELAKRCAEFHELYPKDLLFKFGSGILRLYNAKFKGVHLAFVTRTMNAYFDKNLTPPKSFALHPINFCAVELSRLLKALSSDVQKITFEENHALVDVEISGDRSEYGKMWGTLPFKCEFEEVEGIWKLRRIVNVRELVPPVLDMAETYWPAAWDLGIKL
ncbi:MAG: hypothetical protein J5809_04270 [Selenomonadaceae bacterium]|nr:hypothetical protein [Selenomonadaceae bacterium]